MIALFTATCILGFILYVPGAIILRALRFSGFLSAILAPVVSGFAIIVTGIALRKCGIFANWIFVVGPLAIASVFAFSIDLYLKSRNRLGDSQLSESQKMSLLGSDLGICGRHLALALLVNAIIGAGVFLLSLDGPNSFPQGFDVGHHLAHIRANVQYGSFSTLNVSLYGFESGGFYPSLFHILASIPVSMLGVSPSLAMNAEVLLLIVAVYTLGVFLVGHMILPDHRYSALCMVALSLCFAGFPWALLRYCTLMANVCAMAFLPLLLACFMCLVEARVGVKQRLFLCLLFAMSVVVVAVAHPNGVFTAVVFLFPYCISQILKACNSFGFAPRRRIVAKCALVAGFSLITVAVWLFCFHHPSFQAIVTYNYKEMLDASSAVKSVVFQQMRGFAPNVPLAVLVLAGLVVSAREKGSRWLLLPYAFSACMLALCEFLPSCQLKFLFCGFWYNHDYRIMAVFAFCSLPLAAISLTKLLESLESILSSASSRWSWCAKRGILKIAPCSLLVMVVCLMLVCFPGYEGLDGKRHRLPMAQAYAKLREVNDWNGKDTSYHSEERAFVQKALDVLPEDALVLNIPLDGSGYAYGLDGLNVYFRTNNSRDRTGDDEALVLQRLVDAADDKQVSDAMKRMNVKYVLQLDQGMEDSSSIAYVFRNSRSSENESNIYCEKHWRGLVDLNDKTEGFEVVLSEGDMRLYRVTCLD